MLLKDFITEGIRSLEFLYPSSEARSIVQMLCGSIAGTKSYTHIIEPSYELSSQILTDLQNALGRLQAGEPIQYVTGEAEFCGRVFKVGPEVLIPRPETEILALEASRLALRRAPSVRVLDLCTGSGCIAWTVALATPGSFVVGVDISDAALKLASSQPFDASSAPVFVKADVLDVSQPFPYGPFDIILSNPPYILDSEKFMMRANVLGFEPAQALFVPDADPLVFYRAIAEWSRRFLAEGGEGMTEINEALGPQTAGIFADAGFTELEIVRDLSGKERFVKYSRPSRS